MAYTKKTWVTGEKVTADKLNNIEQGVADAHSEFEQKASQTDVNALNERVTNAESTLGDKANKNDVYTKQEVDNKIINAGNSGSVDLSDYAKTEDVEAMVNERAYKSEVTELEGRVETLENNSSGTDNSYDDTEVRQLIADEEARAVSVEEGLLADVNAIDNRVAVLENSGSGSSGGSTPVTNAYNHTRDFLLKDSEIAEVNNTNEEIEHFQYPTLSGSYVPYAKLYDYFRMYIFTLYINPTLGTNGSNFAKGRFLNQASVNTTLHTLFEKCGYSGNGVDSFEVELFGAAYSVAECSLKLDVYDLDGCEHELLLRSTDDYSATNVKSKHGFTTKEGIAKDIDEIDIVGRESEELWIDEIINITSDSLQPEGYCFTFTNHGQALEVGKAYVVKFMQMYVPNYGAAVDIRNVFNAKTSVGTTTSTVIKSKSYFWDDINGDFGFVSNSNPNINSGLYVPHPFEMIITCPDVNTLHLYLPAVFYYDEY